MGWIRNTVNSVKSRRPRAIPQLVNLVSFLASVIILSEGLACLVGADSPKSLLGVVISESMEPGIKRGDIMVLNISKDPIHAGEIILFNVDGLDVPIVHRVITVHGHRNTGKVYILTKGDNNHLDDRILYARGQRWLLRHHVIARVVGLLPYVGWIKLILTENPIIKCIVLGTLALLIATSKN